jgi:hypothetical protein
VPGGRRGSFAEQRGGRGFLHGIKHFCLLGLAAIREIFKKGLLGQSCETVVLLNACPHWPDRKLPGKGDEIFVGIWCPRRDIAESRDARRNMQLHAALGAVLFLTKGSGPETLAAWTSVFEIAESLDDVDYRLRALWGLFVDCITSGRYRAALAVAERFCTCAAKSTDPADGPIGDRLVGVALLALGDQEGARRHIERMLSGYVARGSHIIRFQYDQRVVARSYHSHVLWLQGFADQAMRSVECQVVNARASDHPVSLSHALLQAACPVALLVGDLTLAERYVKAIMDLSARHAVELWNVGGRCFEGMLLIKRSNIGARRKSQASSALKTNSISRAVPNAVPIAFKACRGKQSRVSTFVWRLPRIAAYYANLSGTGRHHQLHLGRMALPNS